MYSDRPILVPNSGTQEDPRCPTCGARPPILWSDNTYEGCHRCDYLGDGKVIRDGDIEKARRYDLKHATT